MASDDLINQRLGNGQYEIKSLLGRGGMATVYLARQSSMNRDVAIKLMSPELADDEQFVARFEHEAQVIAKLQHPHILPVIDFGREGKHIYIVMQLLGGGSLDNRLRGGPLPVKLASRMLDQIASALSFAHEQGVIHRDLKPNNVLLDERDNAYLVDFGIAKMLAGTTKLTATGNILGTPAYMAPEQWRGEAVDARTDIYSLGVMLYEMVLGRLPFEGETPYTLMYKHFNDAPPPPREMNPNLDPGIEAVILRALAKNADDRFQSAEDMAEAFEGAVRGIATTARPASPGADMERTLLGDEALPPSRATPSTVAGQAAPLAGQAAPPTRAAGGGGQPPAGPAPTRAAGSGSVPGGAASAPPPKRGLNPIMLGGAAVVVIALIAVGAFLALGGGNKQSKPTDTPTTTSTATPTDTPTVTATPTQTPTDTLTPTPRTTTATILAERANVRSGPGLDYGVVATVARDTDLIVVGVSEDGGWYQVAGAGIPGAGWVSAEIVRITGNSNIPVVVLPTATPTATPQPTDTPTPTSTPTPSDTPTPTLEPADPALFVPTEFEPVTLATYDLTLDYPANWTSPSYLSALGYVSMQPLADLDADRYPWVRLSRGTPDQMVERNLTTDASSPGSAVENTVGMLSGAHRTLTDVNFPTVMLNTQLSTRDSWAWVIEVGPQDWVYVIGTTPRSDLEETFGTDVLERMVRSLVIDGQPLVGEPVGGTATPTGPVSAELPLQLGTPVLDRFNDNANDWRFASIIDGQLVVEGQELDSLRWAFAYPLLQGDAAFYAQAQGELVSDTNFYEYGLAFRVEDGNNFYYFAVDHFQRYGLFAFTNGTLNDLIPATFDSNIQVGTGQTNTLGVLVIGDYIEVYLNGQRVGAVVDDTHKSGGARVMTYTYQDSDSPVVAAFDDFAYVPLIINDDPTLNDQRSAVIATVQSATGITALPQSGASQLVALQAGQLFVALAHSVDNRYLYGYGQGATGWIPVADVALTRAGAPVAVGSLAALDSTVQGILVQTWPVIWPAGDSVPSAATPTPQPPAVTPTPPPGMTMIAYGQTVTLDTANAVDGTLQIVFNGVVGNTVTLAVSADNAGLDTDAQILAPNNSVVAQDDDSGPGLNPRLDGVTLPSSGLFTIEIQVISGSGSLQVTLTRAS